MPYFDHIICPYCLGKEFSHTDVHFRMETVFDESQLNDEGRTESEIERMPDGTKKQMLLEQTNLRKLFLSRDDEKYSKFWSPFKGGTSEQSLGHDSEFPCHVHQLPILDPGRPAHRNVLRKQAQRNEEKEAYLIFDGDGMASMVEDVFGKRTNRRVCPHCHNPLPRQYGKNPVKFISVVGVTGAGKTVYISQLLKHMSDYLANVGMAVYFTSDHEQNFISTNAVKMGEPLPNSTGQGTFSQPMFYDLVTKKNNDIITYTIVIYDIAGEDCQNATDMAKYGDYINHSDGIILLVDPSQLNLAEDNLEARADPTTVLNTIHAATMGAVERKNETPVAVCISKCDTFDDSITIGKQDIAPATDRNGNIVPEFNATLYNELEVQLKRRINRTLQVALENGYQYYNYFTFSAIGGPVEMKETPEGRLSYPVGPPVPRRIAEPLLWLFHKFGYIRADIPIRLPEPRPMPEQVEVPVTGLKKMLGKKKFRPLTEDEKNRYWYEETR